MILDFFKITPRSRKIKLHKSRRGVLFSNPGWFRKTIFYTGSYMFLISLSYLTYLYYPIAAAYFNYWESVPQTQQVTGIVPTPTLVPAKSEEETPKGYSIEIPKILAKATVVDNVSPFNSTEYLKVLGDNTVAQAKGTSAPGSGNGHSLYIFAHSTNSGLSVLRNNAVFYLLGELKPGDEVTLTKDGEVFNYRVYNHLVVNASQTEYLKYSDPDKEVLILQTCWPIGTDWKRLLIFAEKV